MEKPGGTAALLTADLPRETVANRTEERQSGRAAERAECPSEWPPTIRSKGSRCGTGGEGNNIHGGLAQANGLLMRSERIQAGGPIANAEPPRWAATLARSWAHSLPRVRLHCQWNQFRCPRIALGSAN